MDIDTDTSFVRWLHKVCVADPERTKPFSTVYDVGPQIESALGIDGDFDLELISLYLRKTLSPEEVNTYLIAVIQAESSWRMDSLGLASDSDVLVPEIYEGGSQCSHTDLNGKRCRDEAVSGTTRCKAHGGSILDPDVRRSVLLVAYARMMKSSSLAVDSLVDVMENSTSSLARVYAAREVLDRVGLVFEGGAHQGTTDTPDESREEVLESLRKQMETARDRLQIVAVPADVDSEVVDAEVIVVPDKAVV